MAEKCALCKEKIKTTFLDKVDGTIIKIKKDKKTEKVYVCSSCQKEQKDKLKEKVNSELKA